MKVQCQHFGLNIQGVVLTEPDNTGSELAAASELAS